MNDPKSKTYDPKRDYIKPSDQVDYSLPFSEIEEEIFNACKPFDEESMQTFVAEVERAKVKWACISSKTQREHEKIYDFKVYENLVEINHHYSGISGSEPPDRSNHNINGFSKKAKYRMMKKIKTMRKKELDLPYFITLTYHRNMMEFQQAKKHLNTFFQRFRRIGDFQYMWKMEPQKRGSIHFHLMAFFPEGMFPEKYQSSKRRRLEFVRMRVSAAWNEIAEPNDHEHLQAGTNVRDVKNWKMAAGYLSKYMKKEFSINPWIKEKLEIHNGTDSRHNYQKVDGTACRKVYFETKKIEPNTGRFWGVSNNFDFRPHYRYTLDLEKDEEAKALLKEICEAAYGEFLTHIKQRAEELKKIKSIKPNKYQKEMKKLKKQTLNQRQRYEINLEKIEKGMSVQAELSQVLSREIIHEEFITT